MSNCVVSSCVDIHQLISDHAGIECKPHLEKQRCLHDLNHPFALCG